MIELEAQAALPARRDVLAGHGSRGVLPQCPACGHGKLFRKYLKVVDRCDACGEEMHHHRADDAPPYFTIFIVGHIIVGGILSLETAYAPEAGCTGSSGCRSCLS